VNLTRARIVVFCLGFGIGLAGDACHVASGTTAYDWDGVPTIWKSAIWFPFVVGLAVLVAAEAGRRVGLPSRSRSVADVVVGAAAVLALYAFTATLRDQATTVGVVLTAAVAIALWAWWDPTPRAFAIATGAAVLGPVTEMLVAASGASHYAGDSDALGGVAPWLPCLYLGAGAIASGVLVAVGGTAPTTHEPMVAQRE
jgi:hypothetical protein